MNRDSTNEGVFESRAGVLLELCDAAIRIVGATTEFRIGTPDDTLDEIYIIVMNEISKITPLSEHLAACREDFIAIMPETINDDLENIVNGWGDGTPEKIKQFRGAILKEWVLQGKPEVDLKNTENGVTYDTLIKAVDAVIENYREVAKENAHEFSEKYLNEKATEQLRKRIVRASVNKKHRLTFDGTILRLDGMRLARTQNNLEPQKLLRHIFSVNGGNGCTFNPKSEKVIFGDARKIFQGFKFDKNIIEAFFPSHTDNEVIFRNNLSDTDLANLGIEIDFDALKKDEKV